MKVPCIFWYEKYVALSAVQPVSACCLYVEADGIIIRRISYFLFGVPEIRSRAVLERWKSRIRAAGRILLLVAIHGAMSQKTNL